MGRTHLGLAGALLLGVLSASAEADTPFAQPMVSITLDDGFQSQYDLARPALNQRGIKATWYLVSQPIQQSWSGYLTLAQARAVAADGHEIGNHTATHPHLPQLTAAQIDQELSSSNTWLQTNLGVTVTSFASPYGEFNDAVVDRAKAYFTNHRAQSNGRDFSEYDVYRMRAAYVRNTTTVAQIQAWIDQTVVERSWLILTFHDFTSGPATKEVQYTAADFAAVLDYLKSRGIAVVTVAQGLAQMGKTQDTEPKKWILGDYFGNDVEDWSWAKVNFRQTAVVRNGRVATSFEASNWGGLALHMNRGGFDAAVWPTLEFWVHGGTAGGQKIRFSLHNGSVALGSAMAVDKLLGHPIAANSWEKVTLPLSTLGVTSGAVGEVHLEDTTGGVQPTLYVDSILLRKDAAPPPPPPPVASYVIYGDALAAGWEDWSWAVHDLAQTAVVHAGAKAVSFTPNNFDALYFHHAGLDTSAYTSIELYINGGPAGGQTLIVAVWDGPTTELGHVDVTQMLGHPLRPNTWERVVVPLTAVRANGRPLRDLYLQDYTGLKQPAVYVDDVRLIQ